MKAFFLYFHFFLKRAGRSKEAPEGKRFLPLAFVYLFISLNRHTRVVSLCAEMRAAWKEDTRQHNGSWEAARLPANDLATCCGTAAALPRCLPLPLPSRALSWFLSGLFMRGSPMPAMQLVAGKPVGGRARASAMFRVVHHLSNLQTEKYSGRGHRRLRARNVSFSLSSWFHVPFLVFILDSFMRLFRLLFFFGRGTILKGRYLVVARDICL